ncbi:hypothetical protein SDC9_88707 [bioreactor metagenome]|uniref:Uncharacterized protein n=1 Tax=bioreactor metagenome TaxID=1076179 RepID=A0A644ZMB6_9ZZZZ
MIEFVKDGTFEETMNYDGDISLGKGIWSWLYENQEQDLKNKQAVVLSYTTDGTTIYGGASMSPDGILVFDELSKDEVIVIVDYNTTDTDGSSTTVTGTMTYEPK